MELSPAITPTEYWRSKDGFVEVVIVREYKQWEINHRAMDSVDDCMRYQSGDYHYFGSALPIVFDGDSVHFESPIFHSTPAVVLREVALSAMREIESKEGLEMGLGTVERVVNEGDGGGLTM